MQFDTDLLQPQAACFGPHPMDGLFIRIPLARFSLGEEIVDTALRADFVFLPTNNLASLSGLEIDFSPPAHLPAPEASIYIEHAHHPVYIQKIIFYECSSRSITAKFITEIDFDFEGLDEFGKTPWTFSTQLNWVEQAQEA